MIVKQHSKSSFNNHFRAARRRMWACLIANNLVERPWTEKQQPMIVMFAKVLEVPAPSKSNGPKWLVELYRAEHPKMFEYKYEVKKRRAKIKKERTERREVYTAYINSPEWRKKREEAFDAHGRVCRECGGINRLEVHHLHYKNFKNELMEDLAVLCRLCHRREHNRKKREKKPKAA